MAFRSFASRAAVALQLQCQSSPHHVASATSSSAFSLLRLFSSSVSEGVRFLPSHEWVSVEGDSTATVGISHFAQSELGEVVFVDLPEVGRSVNAGETFGVVESVKAASDVYSPVSGEVTEVNNQLTQNPGLINSSPFSEGWIMKLKLSNQEDLDKLLSKADYEKSIESEH